ncbi:hypothetical protein MT325_m470L [Paramecium bursaria chlorella virus MT325]|uniref:Uncharacterized protein m470L n=1 Tax=Paramecium bursaria Chlorella virus MT325 TaxID=346932 RepID=A7IUK0_PBCVM|nr:hypothetical protein MT325_m470L [Paramecium bursaria chlorella virus MT325]
MLPNNSMGSTLKQHLAELAVWFGLSRRIAEPRIPDWTRHDGKIPIQHIARGVDEVIPWAVHRVGNSS